MASTPKGGTAATGKSSIMRSFLNNGETTTTKRNRGELSASPQLANKAKRGPGPATSTAAITTGTG